MLLAASIVTDAAARFLKVECAAVIRQSVESFVRQELAAFGADGLTSLNKTLPVCVLFCRVAHPSVANSQSPESHQDADY